MSIKERASVERYTESVVRMRNMLENLIEFVETLPAPDENDELQNLHYGHLSSVIGIVSLVETAVTIADGFNG